MTFVWRLSLLFATVTILIIEVRTHSPTYTSTNTKPDIKNNVATPTGPIDIFNPPTAAFSSLQVILPDMSSITSKVSHDTFVYDQDFFFRQTISELQEKFKVYTNPMDFARAAYSLSQDKTLNRGILIRALSNLLAHRNDSQLFKSYKLFEIAPSLSFPNTTMTQLHSESQKPEGQRACVVVDERTAPRNGDESKLWYWREDLMLNSHHWFWHIYYPFVNNLNHPDRRGELFYFFHHDMVARYHAERLSNGLPPIRPFRLAKGAKIPVGYKSGLTEANARRNWADRPNFQPLPDIINVTFVNLSLSDIIAQGDIAFADFDNGFAILANGTKYSLKNFHGIDAIGDIVEASQFSVNPTRYGSFGYHNAGHVFIGNSMNPINPRGTFAPGVLTDTATAMRDPMFYVFHTEIDNIFRRHKDRLSPYMSSGGEHRLSCPHIDVLKVKVTVPNVRSNHICTFWQFDSYTLANGMDFKRNESVQVCAKHLAHEDFYYSIRVKNSHSSSKQGVVRIFLAPRVNEQGIRYTMKQQRKLFFALDVFVVKLKPGESTITRDSRDSFVTTTLLAPQSNTTTSCNCGFPNHLLLPKGQTSGMKFDLFVVITEKELSSTVPSFANPPVNIGETGSNGRGTGTKSSPADNSCQDVFLYCGIRRSKYPDVKPMGYPFDRRLQENMDNLDSYVKANSNMGTTIVTITHVNEVRKRSKRQ